MDNQVVPIWLPGFLEPANKEHKDRYFAMCKEHGATDEKDKRKGQKNYYCVDCETGPLCEKGFKEDHGGHTVLQVRKDSWHDVVRIGDISPLFNIDHIQIFRINGNDVVFLPSRPQAKPTKGSPSHCDVCGRSLESETAHFCSLFCKVNAIEGHPQGISPVVPKKKTARLSSKKGREKEALAVANKKRAGKDEKKNALSYAPSPPVRGPPAVLKKKRSSRRSRSSSKKAVAPGTPDQPFYELPDSPDTVLSSHDDDADDEADDVSSGYRSSSSQDSLETRMIMRFPK